jgi:hypothetical protein
MRSGSSTGHDQVMTGLGLGSCPSAPDPARFPRTQEGHPLTHPKWIAITEERGLQLKCLGQVFPILLLPLTLLAPEIL